MEADKLLDKYKRELRKNKCPKYAIKKNNKVKEGVTTNHDECSGVGGSLSPVEARSSIIREEIV